MGRKISEPYRQVASAVSPVPPAPNTQGPAQALPRRPRALRAHDAGAMHASTLRSSMSARDLVSDGTHRRTTDAHTSTHDPQPEVDPTWLLGSFQSALRGMLRLTLWSPWFTLRSLPVPLAARRLPAGCPTVFSEGWVGVWTHHDPLDSLTHSHDSQTPKGHLVPLRVKRLRSATPR